MTPFAEDPGKGERRRAVTASERAYRTLIRTYPKELRDEYGEEMVRSFRDLCREELLGRGRKGLAALWARTLPELAFTALRERNDMLARNAYLPARPEAVARWGGLSALLGGALGTAFYPFYPVGMWGVPIQVAFLVLLLCALLSSLALFGLYGRLAVSSVRPNRLAAVGAAFAFAAAVSWLAMGAFGALGLASGWAIGPAALSAVAGLCCWLVALLLLGIAAFKARLPGLLRTLPLALAVLVPVGHVFMAGTSFAMPLVSGLPFLGSAVLGWSLLKNYDAALRFAPEGAALADGEAAKEKELLQALRRHGELTVAGAALETSLSVEGADRMLSELAAKGHLEVRAEGGRLRYSLWEDDG